MWYILFFIFNLCKCDEYPVVTINEGILQGKYWTSSFQNRQFAGFTGIPYAKPPLGALRFEAPVAIDPWNSVYDATLSHSVCPHMNIYDKGFPTIGNEDCLYLNVYTPKIPKSDNDFLPVMVYFHGGSFEMGSAKPEWLGPKYLLDKNIVLVVVNYRLGALGFLSTSDDVVPGNNGLKDQNLALQWVKRNIAYFGGNPNNVTIFGNSAGSCSVHLHMMSPISKNLFHKAILQSGSSVSYILPKTSTRAKRNAVQLGKLLNCSASSSLELITCLRSISVDEIIEKQNTFVSWDGDSTVPFLPVIEPQSEDSFLVEHPIETIMSGNSANIPMIIGIVSQEAGYKASFLNGKPELLSILNDNFDLIIPDTFLIQNDRFNSSKKIRYFYFGDKDIDNNTKTELASMYSDGMFLYSHNLTVQLHSQFTNQVIYQYLFDYRGSESYSTLFGDADYDYGVCHTDELFSLFKLGHTFPNYTPTDIDVEMIKTMTTLWTNFAISGSPTSNSISDKAFESWTPTDINGMGYYHIKNYDDVKMKDSSIFSSRTEFWRSLPIIEL